MKCAVLVSTLCVVAACSSREQNPAETACAALRAGDLVITEIYPNPAGVDDGQEWFEVHNTTSRALDVAGLDLVASKDDGTDEKTHRVRALSLAPGYTVLGDAAGTLPAHVDYGYGNDLGALRNDAGRVALRCGQTLLDAATYGDVRDATSRQLSSWVASDPAANDVATNWCDATAEFAAGSRGSPGAANEPCDGVGPATCSDGGTSRAVVPPAAGQLVISEIMPNPRAVADESGEWFEVTLLADADLNGLQIGTTPGTPRTTIAAASCLRRRAGARVVFARSDDPMRNGALPAVDATFNFDLTNAGGTLFVGAGGAVLDQVSWTRSVDGAALSLDPGRTAATANDDETSWCAAEATYGDGDRGTPGEVNEACPLPLPAGRCMDGDGERDVVAPEPGDLVITEVLANPAGADDDKEWFEVLVKRDVALNGLALGATFPTVAQTIDGAACVHVAAGTYLVFSHNDGVASDGGLPRVDFRTRFTLGNTTPSLFLARDGVLLDQVTLGAAVDGASWSLTPEFLDPTANDDASRWCTAASPYGEGDNRGTPGALNYPGCVDPNRCVENGALRDVVAPRPGQLVISEVMADPAAAGDEEGEWFEETVLADVDVNGLELGTTPGAPRVTIADAACRRRTAGSRLLFARNADPALNGGLPALEGTFRFALGNSAGSLYVGRGGVTVDAVAWTRSDSGVAASLDPTRLDATTNDDPLAFCAATSTYGAGDRGTPGRPNDVCPLVLPAGKCLEGDVVRDAVAPAAGDLVITELLANPTGSDAGKEWFEVLATRDVDLVGLELGTVFPTVAQRLGGPECRRAAAGSRLVFAHNDGTVPDGGLPRVDQRVTFDLVNADRGLFLALGGQLIDAASYAATREGTARSLSASKSTAAANDDLASWCDATVAYGDGDRGTPGAANPECPPVLPAGQCLDGQLVRQAVTPAIGDVVITELLADPTGPDAGKEWFELLVTRDVDLAGLELGLVYPDVLARVEGPDCRRVAAGSYLVVASGDGSLPDGGLPRVDLRVGFGLPNSDRGLFVAVGGMLLDATSYTTSVTGVARNLALNKLTPTQNDDDSAWCDSQGTYGDGDRGTPGAPNSACPLYIPPGRCQDDAGVRAIVAPASGDLVITEIHANPEGADAGKEWFEVTALRTVDLNGLELGTAFPEVRETIDARRCLRVPAGGILVFAHNDGLQPDGGLPRVDVRFGFDLANADRALFLASDGVLVDQAAYGQVASGVARSLPWDKTSATLNDDLASWCAAVDPYGDGDLGTPGAPNPECPFVPPAGMCIGADGATVRDIREPAPGDLVITEFFPDATGADDGKEWFEVYVARDVDLNGLGIGATGGDVARSFDSSSCLAASAGQYLLFSHNDGEQADGGLPEPDYRFTELTLVNDDRGLFLALDGVTIDATTYATTDEGIARSLSSTRRDATQNDDATSWCNATAPYGDGDLGTPGAPNPECPFVPPPGTCLDGDTLRALVAPAAGDLVVTEIFADAVGADAGKEWFEVRATRDVDLNGLGVGLVAGAPSLELGSVSCLRATAGTLLFFASTGSSLSGVDASFDFLLPNGGGTLILEHGGALVDAAPFVAAGEGVARNLSATRQTAADNDDLTAWCDAEASFAGGLGTPGAANLECAPPGQCRDGASFRAIDTAQSGELVITEIFADATGADAGKEWFELLATAPLDLNGVQYGLTGVQLPRTLGGSSCRPVAAGTYLVFSHNDGVQPDGGLPRVDDRFAFDLGNSSGSLSIGVGGAILDTATWTAATEGRARSLSGTRLDTVDNDDVLFWCDATAAYGDGDFGTPGGPNPECPLVLPLSRCLDGAAIRDVVAPAAGDLVITEVFANATGVDTGKQWLELLVTRDVDLNRLQLGTAPPMVRETLAPLACEHVTAGTRLIFSNGDGEQPDGGLPRVDQRFAFTLATGAGGLFIGRDGAILDQVTWTQAGEGASWSRSDDGTGFCDAAEPYGDGDLGTPGEENPVCPAPGTCLENGVARAAVPPVVGDLVISELLTDVVGADEGKEWFEVSVLRDVDLAGLEIGLTFPTLGRVYRTSGCMRAAAGSCLIFAHNDGAEDAGGLPRIDHRFSFSLVNDDRGLFVGLGGALLDAVTYGTTDEGVARSLSSTRIDPAANDLATSFCAATTSYNAVDLGTPGAANPVCPFVLPDDRCLDGGVERDVVAPVAGDLVISEVMPTPNGTQGEREWFEVTVLRDVDLRGVWLGVTGPTLTLSEPDCRRRAAGTRLVFARSGAATNGGLGDPEAIFGFGLGPTSSLAVGRGVDTLDSVTWSGITTAASTSLDPDAHTVADNDDLASWCPGATPYGPGGSGTPGAANPQCIAAGMCLDGGVPRAAVTPQLGDLVVTELMYNPTGTDGFGREWFEVAVTRDVDLNDLLVTTGALPGTTLASYPSADCLRVTAGSFLVFAQSTDPLVNAGLTGVDFLFTPGLANSGASAQLNLVHGGTPLDSVTWTTVTDGRSRTVKASAATPALNDDAAASWCTSASTYGDGTQRGSPGALDPACP